MILDITNPVISDSYKLLFLNIKNILIEFENIIVDNIQCEIIVIFLH